MSYQTAEEHLPAYRVRPRFQIETAFTIVELADKINLGLQRENAPCKGRVNPTYATLYLPHEEQHYWSPRLTLTLEETENGGSLLRGLYGPRPTVWTMFIFFYAIIGFAMMVIGIIGLSHLTLGDPAPILWLVPLLAIVFLSLYLVAFFGQKLGHDQMVILHQFIEESTGLEIQ